MKDITSTSFGLFIAFLLPGLAALDSMTFWFTEAKNVFNTIIQAKSDFNLFLFVLLAGVTIGLTVSVLRWLLFERLISKLFNLERLDPNDFAKLSEESTLTAFRAAVDEHYRYHQFWGGMTIVMPSYYAGWLSQSWSNLSALGLGASITIFILLEGAVGFAAFYAYKLFVTRSKPILKGA